MENQQQRQLTNARNRAANAKTPEQKSAADAEMVRLISQKPRSR